MFSDQEQEEATILENMLLVISPVELGTLATDFAGHVITESARFTSIVLSEKMVYVCGDFAKAPQDLLAAFSKRATCVRSIKELSLNPLQDIPMANLGQVPRLVHNVGVLYPCFFDSKVNFFKRISTEHALQNLTESNKPGVAHRTGIYLTPIKQKGQDLHFNLLRCSSNLSGPTEDFCTTDTLIVEALNTEANNIFKNHAPLNHVLAQIYYNTPGTPTQKQTKAKIKAHADKTKDMPRNGIMAFTTFYDNLEKLQQDNFDYHYKGKKGLSKCSALTTLVFHLKPSVASRPECTLEKKFSITLSPHSVFYMPLSTNRFYTHEIRPSSLEAKQLPTRMGYVVRCSATEAVFHNNQTYIKKDGLVKLQPSSSEGMEKLRDLYAQENKTDAFIDYGFFDFSMNKGDYLRPTTTYSDFRTFVIKTNFKTLTDIRFESTKTKGRQGTVLVQPDKRGTPIVRMTDSFTTPTQQFPLAYSKLNQQIQEIGNLGIPFNNALVETYTNEYAKMGFHSDLALDLDEKSTIAVVSCYQYPERQTLRKLIVEPKNGQPSFEIPLAHNSVVIFSVATNSQYRHKIVLDSKQAKITEENTWLGITFRVSKTFITDAHFEDGTPLTLADDVQRQTFYTLRGKENRETNFSYPFWPYTLSPQDLLPVS